MLMVRVDDIETFRTGILAKNLVERFGIRISDIFPQPYGKEVNIIDMTGVCWHFVE